MPLIGVPNSISADLLYALARAGHGDKIVIADANFPADSIAVTASIPTPIRINGSTSDILEDILKLLPLDQYVEYPIAVMDRVSADKDRKLPVPAYAKIAAASRREVSSLDYIERYKFYELAKNAFVVVQTTDSTLYSNVIIYKGVIWSMN
jgi:L-fucose mutarotase